jgi:hypothetical protein
MPHKSFSVFLARCATDFVILLHIIKQGASNQPCGVKKGEKLCKMSILDFDFLAAKKQSSRIYNVNGTGFTHDKHRTN